MEWFPLIAKKQWAHGVHNKLVTCSHNVKANCTQNIVIWVPQILDTHAQSLKFKPFIINMTMHAKNQSLPLQSPIQAIAQNINHLMHTKKIIKLHIKATQMGFWILNTKNQSIFTVYQQTNCWYCMLQKMNDTQKSTTALPSHKNPHL